MQEILYLLKISCHVRKSINCIDFDENGNFIDYGGLVHSLVESNSHLFSKYDICDMNVCRKNGKKYFIRFFLGENLKIVSKCLFTECNPLESSKMPNTGQQFMFDSPPFASILFKSLRHVMNEELLDSILPFICAYDLPGQMIVKYDAFHICALKGKTSIVQPKQLGTCVQNAPTSNNGKINGDKTTEQKDQHSRKNTNQTASRLSKYL